jgi:predicted enzyme related to lactoylglutathione lyase
MKNRSLKLILITVAFLTTFGAGFALSKIVSNTPETLTMKKVTGIGGIFFKCKDPKKMKEWYSKNLGLQTDEYGTTFEWRTGADSTKKGFTQWSPFKESTKYFEPSTKDFMINYRVENIQELVDQLKADKVAVLDTIESYEYGKFVHILDIEGNKIELWQPNDIEYGKIVGGVTK